MKISRTGLTITVRGMIIPTMTTIAPSANDVLVGGEYAIVVFVVLLIVFAVSSTGLGDLDDNNRTLHAPQTMLRSVRKTLQVIDVQ